MNSICFFAGSFVLICIYQEIFAENGSYKDMDNLHTDLFRSYKKSLIPYGDVRKPVEVNVTIGILSIKEFDEVSGQFSIVGYLYTNWKDPRMAWDPKNYSEIESIRVPQKDVWIPPITLVNPYEEINVIGNDFLSVLYSSDGTASWVPGDIISVSCIADVTYFPFDKQTCWIVFNCWGVGPWEVRLLSPSSKVATHFYYEHGTWELLNTSVTSDIQGSTVSAVIYLKRRPAYVITTILVPVLCVLSLDVLVFILPIESGERVSFSITVLLSLAVFLTIVGDSLPKTSDPMSIISFFLLVAMLISTITCFMTVVCIHIYSISVDKTVPACIKGLIRLCTCAKSKGTEQYGVDFNVNNLDQSADKKPVDREGRQLQPTVTWQDVSNFVDKVMIAFNGIAIVTITVVFCVLMTNNK